ncbi:Subtilisin-like protease [Acorus calamus]|uniref:Subtilisin-like protease n=1 Tax=Acorus calamus TaxID=4465 RepID=A0AAV9D8T8_ACOCL|nr:Subtilisin-like protease [Acorus calamus]
MKGQSIADKHLEEKQYPVIDSASIKKPNVTIIDATYCLADTLDMSKVKGKIVVCMVGGDSPIVFAEEINKAGGVGMILANDVDMAGDLIVDPYMSPATEITYDGGVALYNYINSTKNPTAYITPPKTMLNTKPAPLIAAFSSRGPNYITPEILKPDITAPGVNIIAAYTPEAAPSDDDPTDLRRVNYNIISGTSMSTPHVAGVVGLLKTLYPHWSPAMIQSAIMTTATIKDNTGAPIKNSSLLEANPYDYGSGHIRPNHAMRPGLVYDLTVDDHLNFLCAMNYNSTKIKLFTNKPFTCPKTPLKPYNLNYPSITITYTTTPINVTRTLKNVGPPGTYTVEVKAPKDISVKVEPSMLVFDHCGEEKSFTVSFEYLKGKVVSDDGDVVFGGLTYIVYLGVHKHGKDATSLDHELATDSHYELLGSVLGSKDKAKDAIIYSYNKFINGFSAVLEEEEANAMAENPNVVSVFPDGKARLLLMTHSWDFVGLERGGQVPEDSLWLKSRFGENTIIATLDTGSSFFLYCS